MYLPEGLPHRAEADSFDLRNSILRIVEACRAHKVALFATMLVSIGLVGAYILIWPSVYEAEVLIVAAPEKGDESRDYFYQVWNVFRKDALKNETELMTSRPVLVRTVTQLGLKYKDVYHPFLSHATYLWTDSWVGTRYRAVKRFLFHRKSPYEASPDQIETARIVRDFKAGVQMEAVPDTSVGKLIVRGPSPRVSEIANTLVGVYMDERKRQFVDEARRAAEALSREAERAKVDLDAIEAKRRDYMEKNGILLEFEKDKQEVATAAGLEGKIRDLEAEEVAAERRQEETRRRLAEEPPDIVSGRVFHQNELRERMKATRFELQASLDGVKQRYRPDSPEVQELEARIRELDTDIKGQAEREELTNNRTLNSVYETLRQRDADLAAELKGLRAGLAVRRGTLRAMNARLSRIPEKLTEATDLAREQHRQQQRYEMLTDRLTMAQVSMAAAATAPSSMRIADDATPPGEPTWPKTKLLLLVAAFGGFAGGVASAVLMDLLQGRVTRIRLLQTQTGLPVYGVLELSETPARELLPSARKGKPRRRTSTTKKETSQDG